uniref:Uncharacterized protein n=1 Tax=Candidatus Methanophaga sp. ANME-1 ERB7 TaxID=2759913 RepID=A0A7G9ZD98_9EURY|nr:hypothetical protein DKLEMCON_00014 [Methanosarcinales archaeon ANME-1 ERB7]
MPFSVEISGQREGDSLYLEHDFYSDAHVIYHCTPSGEMFFLEDVDFGVLRYCCAPLDRGEAIISEEPFEAGHTRVVEMIPGLARLSTYCHITE